MKKVNSSPLLPMPPNSPDASSLTYYLTEQWRSLILELSNIAQRLNLTLPEDGTEPMTAPLPLATFTVATLPSASSLKGAEAIVTDANATTFNSVVAGGGANVVPVYSDGTNWRIG